MEDQKRRQVEYHERVHYSGAKPRIVDNSHPFVDWINNFRLHKALQLIGSPMSGKTVLSLCGGDGQEADFLQRQGARVTVVDLSTVALEAARTRNPVLHCCCMDAESLSFPDCSFDWAFVRDGLHHLARPLKGLYELERVSRDGFVILEGQDSLLVRMLSACGIAEIQDPAGGYVYRFSRRELHKIFCSMQSVGSWRIHTAWLPFGGDIVRYVPAFTRFLYPVMNHRLIRKLLITRRVRKIFKAAFEIAEFITGRWGNSLIVVARKKTMSGRAGRNV
jgi:ubiquinone/menaquinone biosynthesis C-methylase UbiE